MPKYDSDQNIYTRLDRSSTKEVTLSGNVPGGGSLTSPAWEDARGYRNAQLGCRSDASHNWDVHVLWSVDGSNQYQDHADVVTGAPAQSNVATPFATRAPYFKLKINNTDGGNAHEMTAVISLQP